MSRERWHRLALEVGFLVAPAGLNFLGMGTTGWIYEHCRVLGGFGLPAFAFRTTGERIACDRESLRQHLTLLRTVDAAWRAGIVRTKLARLSSRTTPGLRSWIASLGFDEREFPLRAFLVRAAAVLDALVFVPSYFRYAYLSDLVENGLTILLVERRTARRRPTQQ